MKIALFGGTFDPIHAGHLQAAQAALRQFRLDRILFIPTGIPPHKLHNALTPFSHRYAMVALACAGNRRFAASLLEAPRDDGRPNYSLQTARAAKRSLGRRHKLYFLIGVDAFLDLPHWKEYGRLLGTMDFIVASRPGFNANTLRNVVPRGLLAIRQPPRPDTIALRHTALYLLRGVDVPVASRDIREAVRAGRRVAGLVPRLVEQYILKEGLYRSRGGGAHGA